MRHSGIRSQNHLGSGVNVGIIFDYRVLRFHLKDPVGTSFTRKTGGLSRDRLRRPAFTNANGGGRRKR